MPTAYEGPACPDQGTLEMQRPDELNVDIRNLLQFGSANDLVTERGKILRMLMTPAEAAAILYLPVKDNPGWDGGTCDLCRGMHRFVHCQLCHGDCIAHAEPEPRPAPSPAESSMFKRFWTAVVSFGRAS